MVTPLDVFRSYWRNRSLIYQLARREILGRYRGSIMGLLWSFLHPVLMLAVYTFVFSIVFKARWGGGDESRIEFAIILFAGLIVYTVFAECVNRAPSLVLNNLNFVKKVVFPLEILPWVSLTNAVFHAGISVAVLAVFILVAHGSLPWTIVLFPLIVIPLMLLSMGVSWALATLGVYLRDTAHIVGVATTVLMFVSPIFYPASAIPEGFRWIVQLNPLAYLIERTREVLIWNRVPNLAMLGTYSIVAFLIAWLGLAWFQKTRKGFADIL